MNAKQMVKEFGEALIGRVIITQRYGAWPGGAAKVTELLPDQESPEIVMQVESSEHGSIGVFDHESVEFA